MERPFGIYSTKEQTMRTYESNLLRAHILSLIPLPDALEFYSTQDELSQFRIREWHRRCIAGALLSYTAAGMAEEHALLETVGQAVYLILNDVARKVWTSQWTLNLEPDRVRPREELFEEAVEAFKECRWSLFRDEEGTNWTFLSRGT